MWPVKLEELARSVLSATAEPSETSSTGYLVLKEFAAQAAQNYTLKVTALDSNDDPIDYFQEWRGSRESETVSNLQLDDLYDLQLFNVYIFYNVPGLVLLAIKHLYDARIGPMMIGWCCISLPLILK